MSSRLLRDEALEKEDRIDEMKNKEQSNRPAPATSTAGPCPTICQNRRPGTGSYPAPSPDPITHKCHATLNILHNVFMPKIGQNELEPANTRPLTIQIFQMPFKGQQMALTFG